MGGANGHYLGGSIEPPKPSGYGPVNVFGPVLVSKLNGDRPVVMEFKSLGVVSFY